MSMKIHSKIKDYELRFCEDMSFASEIAKVSPRIVILDRNVYNAYKQVIDTNFS